MFRWNIKNQLICINIHVKFELTYVNVDLYASSSAVSTFENRRIENLCAPFTGFNGLKTMKMVTKI